MSEQTETTIEGDAVLTADGCLLIPTNLPAGTVITVTITIGGAEQADQAEVAAPEKPKYLTGGRAINGGGA